VLTEAIRDFSISANSIKWGYIAMKITLTPIGTAHTEMDSVPRHWTVSDVEGTLVIDPEYTRAIEDIDAGHRIVVLFHFHKSSPFSPDLLKQTPPHREASLGVFSICSPRRPNPIGLSVLDVLSRSGNVLHVRGMDMIDGTPIIDIKPHVVSEDSLPSRKGRS
jgi:tRNA-Thr(GGU) m(6)t(6)A37 methyltransferase TsaA